MSVKKHYIIFFSRNGIVLNSDNPDSLLSLLSLLFAISSVCLGCEVWVPWFPKMIAFFETDGTVHCGNS